MLFDWCLLGGIWGIEGLDKGICWVFAGGARRFLRFELWAMSNELWAGDLGEKGVEGWGGPSFVGILRARKTRSG
jgi:hypothetical protein